MLRSDTCRIFRFKLFAAMTVIASTTHARKSCSSARIVRQTKSVCDNLMMTTTLFALHASQSSDVQDFDCSRSDSANESLAFQSREGAFGGLRHRSQIIGEIETVHRYFQERSFLIEEFGMRQQIENERGQALIGVLLTEYHDPMLGLAKIIRHLHEQAHVKLRVRQHHLLHSLPRNAIEFGRTDRLCGVDVSSVLGTTQKIA